MRGVTMQQLIDEVLQVLRDTRKDENQVSMLVDMNEEGEMVFDDVRTITKENAEMAIQKLISVKELLFKEEGEKHPWVELAKLIKEHDEQIKELQKKWSYPQYPSYPLQPLNPFVHPILPQNPLVPMCDNTTYIPTRGANNVNSR